MTVPASAVPESTYELLTNAARTWPDAVATQWIPDPADYARCRAWTYAEVAGAVTRIANGLARLGIQRDDAVTLCGPNCSGLLAATLAAQAAGIAAPVSPALGADQIAGLIGRTRSQVLIAAGPEADPELWHRLSVIARQARMRAVIALRPDGAAGVPPALDGELGMSALYLEELAGGQPADCLAGIRPRAADLAAFVHTGGTTGAPKIAAHTHANQVACARGIAASSGLAPGEGVLAGLPLFHVNALIVTGVAPLLSGARMVWPGPAGYRDPALYRRFWKIVEHYQIAAMSAVPTVYSTLTQVPVDADISSLRIPIVGASPLPAAVREGFARHTGRRLLEGYGLTEATCASTWNRPGANRPGSVGQVLPGQQASRPAEADLRHPIHPAHRCRQAVQARADRRRCAARRGRVPGPGGRERGRDHGDAGRGRPGGARGRGRPRRGAVRHGRPAARRPGRELAMRASGEKEQPR
jgi:fatty-acyl-CoA synthase